MEEKIQADLVVATKRGKGLAAIEQSWATACDFFPKSR